MIDELRDIVSNKDISKDMDLLSENLKHLLNDFIKSDVASLYIYDNNTQDLKLKLFYDRKENLVEYVNHNDRSLSMVDPKGCIGKVFLTKTAKIYNYITSDKDYFQSYDNDLNYKLKSQLIYPIIENNELLGILRLSATTTSRLKKYTKKEMVLINEATPFLVNIINKILSDNDSVTSSSLLDMEILKPNKEVNIDDNSMLLFLSNTVHDIRTPANSLHGFLELLEDQIEDKRLKKFVTNAKESAFFINTLTDSILETAKNRYQTTLASEELVCSITFFSDIANAFSAQMLEKKIHYFIFISPNIPKEIKIDTLKLKRILTNLIGNAYKFTPINHQIDLKIIWDDSANRIKFSIKDTGIGIEEENQKKLFKSFSQAKEDTQDKYGGTGLGLAISASYVAQMGGELKLKSKLDEGSEFYFDLPVVIAEDTPSYEKIYNLKKKILILTDYAQAEYPKFIQQCLLEFGIENEKIIISDTIEDEIGYVICFEEKITEDIIESGKSRKFELLLIEEKLFSLLDRDNLENIKITSENIYNAEALYNVVFSEKKPKVLIVDDNKINVILLESMLEGEYIDITTSLDGEKALKYLKENAKDGNAFDIVYLDNHMNGMSGSELLHKYRKFEVKHAHKPIFAVSITGDPNMSEDETRIYNAIVHKPFKKDDVKEVISAFR